MTKRLAATLALALLVVGCGLIDDRVPLLTGHDRTVRNPAGCYTFSANGPLVVDPKYGTAIINMDTVKVMGLASPPPAVPVAWRPGFTGRRVGSEVEVLDPDGHVVATTGRNYVIEGAGVGGDDMVGRTGLDQFPESVFWSCGDVVLQP
jgi:hypothetical protein